MRVQQGIHLSVIYFFGYGAFQTYEWATGLLSGQLFLAMALFLSQF